MRPWYPAATHAASQPSDLVDALTRGVGTEHAWSLGAVVIAVLAGRLVAGLAFRALHRWARNTSSTLDDALVEHLRSPIVWFASLLALYLALPVVVLPERVIEGLRHALLVAVILGSGWGAARSIRVLEDLARDRMQKSGADNLLQRQALTRTRALRNILNLVIAIVTVGAVLITFEHVRQLGTGLLASAGVAGVIIGFSAQRTISTIVAGIQIALAQPIRVDDVVIVENEWGWIEEVTLTYVVVRIWDQRRLIVPVTHFLEKPFQNWTRTSADLLGNVELHLDYSVPVDALREQLKAVLDGCEWWDGKVQNVQVTGAGERSMVVRALFSAKSSGDAWNLRCHVREQLIRFVCEQYPHALPKLRADVDAEPPALASVRK